DRWKHGQPSASGILRTGPLNRLTANSTNAMNSKKFGRFHEEDVYNRTIVKEDGSPIAGTPAKMHEKNELKSNVRIHMDRREFLSSAGMLLASQSLGALLPAQTKQENARPAGKADHTLRIEPCTLEIGPGVNVKTLAYNGQVPGPLLRLREGVPVSIDVTNASADPDIVHWHGLAIDSLNDGA